MERRGSLPKLEAEDERRDLMAEFSGLPEHEQEYYAAQESMAAASRRDEEADCSAQSSHPALEKCFWGLSSQDSPLSAVAFEDIIRRELQLPEDEPVRGLSQFVNEMRAKLVSHIFARDEGSWSH